MTTFEEFTSDFFEIFTASNFYEGKTYLEYIAEPQTNDEDNIVDTKIVLPLLIALGFESGEITKNQTGGTKDNSRPDFQVKLSDDYRCFLVEDKHTAYDLSKPEPLQQLANYAPSRGYSLGLVCNGRLLLGWDLSNPSSAIPVLYLDIQEIIETYKGQNLFANSQIGLDALTESQLQSLKGLYRRFHRSNFEGIDILIREIGKSQIEWEESTYSQANNPNFDELLIEDLKRAIALLEDDVLYQLDLLLQEFVEYTSAKYLTNGNSIDEAETAPQKMTDLRKQILNYLRVSGLVELDDYSWAEEKLLDYAQNTGGTIRELAEKFLVRLKKAELKQGSQPKNNNVPKGEQLDILSPISESKQKELGIKIQPQLKITKLDPKLQEKLREYQDLVISWQAWKARQSIKHDRAIKTQQFFQSWKEMVTKTIFQDEDETKLKAEFARQTAYVYVIRLLMVRICEDKRLINRKFSDGGFKKWKEIVEPEYLDFAQGMSMDYLLEMSYRSAQSIYAHFFSNEDLFNWYHMNPNTLVRVLHILNRFNLEAIDSDIIGMVYGRYVTEGKHEQGRYFTPRKVVEYMLDSIGYTSDNPDIRDKTLLDLAGGSGSFLVHAARRLINSYRSKMGKIPISNVPAIIQQVKNSLFCLDINPFACYLAETNLLIQVIDLLKQVKETGNLRECAIDRFNVYNTDSLLLPRSENIRSTLLNPVLDLELTTVSQIKTRTERFTDGFDFVVGNPPYVRAEEPDQLAYRQTIVSQGRFETLYKKWDLFIPFIEMSKRLLKSESGRLAIITSNAYENAPYAEKSREMLCQGMTFMQIDFFEGVRLFSDAAVDNVIFIAENKLPTVESNLARFWHSDGQNLGVFSNQDQVNQIELGELIFRQKSVIIDFSQTILLDEIVYISEGMNLASHDKKYPNEFTKDDLISDTQDESHPVRYIEGKDIGIYQINRIRYLEYGENLRAPSRIRRPTFPELYSQVHIVVGKTSGITIAESGIYNSESVRVLILWFKLKGLNNRSVSQDLVEANNSISKRFSLQYLTAILNSHLGQSFLRSISSGTRDDIFSDDLRKIPIKNISLRRQQPFIERVDNLIAWNWEIYELRQLGHKIDFKYDKNQPRIEIDFLQVLAQIKPSSWNFLNAEPQRFEVIGDRNELISKVKIKDDKLIIGRNSELLQSDSPLVLEYLRRYLPQFESKGFTWQSLLTEGKIPKTDTEIERVFTECELLITQTQEKIDNIRSTYQELDQMVNKLYGV